MWNIRKFVKKGEYDYALVPEHPNRTKNGYVLAHRVVVENSLGRVLDKSEIVHHLDGNKHNNDIHNLVVMSSKDHVSEHQRLHGRKYAVIRCPNCLKTIDIPENRLCCKKGGELSFCSRHCSGQFYYRKRLGLLTHEQEIAVSENILRLYTKHGDNSEETVDNGIRRDYT